MEELQRWLMKLQQRAVGFSTLLLIILNTVLLGAFLYVVLPQYDMTFSKSDVMGRVEILSKEFNVDVANVWRVQLASNSRSYMGSYVRNPADKKIVSTFAAAANQSTFTSATPPEAAIAIMNGNSYCDMVADRPIENENAQRFREKMGAKQICWVPIMSTHAHTNNHLIGYVAFIWKNVQDGEQLAAMQARSLGIINQR
jgi:hypothetical protein